MNITEIRTFGQMSAAVNIAVAATTDIGDPGSLPAGTYWSVRLGLVSISQSSTPVLGNGEYIQFELYDTTNSVVLASFGVGTRGLDMLVSPGPVGQLAATPENNDIAPIISSGTEGITLQARFRSTDAAAVATALASGRWSLEQVYG